MPWFKVDDNLAFHQKTVAAGNSAMGLWVRAGSWCAQNLTDGHVPDHMIGRMGTQAQVEKLVSAGLWDRTKSGIVFHQWTDRQPLRVEVDAERQAARDRMRSIRASKKGVKKPSPQVSGSGSPEVPSTDPNVFGNPVPTQSHPNKNFDIFWDAYPRKEAKGAARKAWDKAVKKTSEDSILEGVMKYSSRVAGSEKKFIAHPATWLNSERWDDETADAVASEDNGWFQPFTLPECPPDIADDPERYASWVQAQREAWLEAGNQ